MFNKIVRHNYAGANFLYTWDFGDGTPVSHLENPSHAYTSGGAYTVTLTTKIEGWEGVCSKSTSKVLSIGLQASTSGLSNVTCFNLSNGSITGQAQFGSTPYYFNLNGGAWQSSTVIIPSMSWIRKTALPRVSFQLHNRLVFHLTQFKLRMLAAINQMVHLHVTLVEVLRLYSIN